jgi:carbonic anhydrase/acetyltransferase-like protein (isoleucine patch superfamily)
VSLGRAPAAELSERIVVLASDLFITSTLLKALVKAADPRQGPLRLALRRTPSVDHALPLQDVVVQPLTHDERKNIPAGRLAERERRATEKVLFDAFVCRGSDLAGQGGEVLAHLRATAHPVVVGKKEMVVDVRLPVLPNQAVAVPTMAFPITSSVAVAVRHWTHVLWLNQLAPGICLNLHLRRHPFWTLWRVLTTFSLKKERLLERLSLVHPSARIHPTAYVEGSIVGAGAVVGARASVRYSVVAPAAEVGDHATVLSSVVGTRAYVTPKTFLVWSAVYPDAVVGNHKLQVSLVGRGALVGAWAGFIDAKFQGGIKVELDGHLTDTGRGFLGSCIGHGAQVASKVLVHPGRVVPAGVVVVMRPDEVIERIPADLKPGVPVVRDDGTLRPLAELKGPRA